MKKNTPKKTNRKYYARANWFLFFTFEFTLAPRLHIFLTPLLHLHHLLHVFSLVYFSSSIFQDFFFPDFFIVFFQPLQHPSRVSDFCLIRLIRYFLSDCVAFSLCLSPPRPKISLLNVCLRTEFWSNAFSVLFRIIKECGVRHACPIHLAPV